MMPSGTNQNSFLNLGPLLFGKGQQPLIGGGKGGVGGVFAAFAHYHCFATQGIFGEFIMQDKLERSPPNIGATSRSVQKRSLGYAIGIKVSKLNRGDQKFAGNIIRAGFYEILNLP